MNAETGKWIIFTGIFIVLTGVIIYFFHDKLHWLGRLPGDTHIEKGNTRFYFPVVTMIIVSVLLTIVINIIKRFFH
ncbi:MAG: DUF2905 domain-containing protein [Chitinophagaceae bacterium]